MCATVLFIVNEKKYTFKNNNKPTILKIQTSWRAGLARLRVNIYVTVMYTPPGEQPPDSKSHQSPSRKCTV